jgi:NADH dehydrogenase (ubiquinone) 1 alpha subcomplex subunit 2
MIILICIPVERGVEKHVELENLSSSDVAASVARILSVS